MSSFTYYINKAFSYLAVSFPEYVFAPHSNEEEEETLIDESESEGRRFSTNFKAKYGEECSQFMESSLNDAIVVSTVANNPIAVYFSSPFHENEEAFNQLLSHPVVVEHMKNNFTCWGCDVTSKYGYTLLNEIGCSITELPTLLIMIKKDEQSPLTLLGALGYRSDMNPGFFVNIMDAVVSRTLEEIHQSEMERMRQEEDRRLVQEQQREYEAALEADRQRLSRSEASEVSEMSEASEHSESATNSPIKSAKSELSASPMSSHSRAKTPQSSSESDELKARMEAIRSRIPPEPTSGTIVRVRVIYPNGTKLQRNFLASDAVALLLDMVLLDSYDNAMGIQNFQLCMTMPRLVIDKTQREKTFEELGIKGSCVFRVNME